MNIEQERKNLKDGRNIGQKEETVNKIRADLINRENAV